MTVAFLPKYVARVSAVLVVAVGASACSTLPNWVDPTNWIGGDDTPNDQAPSGQASNGPADQGAQTADNATTPDLSTIPDKPQAPSTADEQKQVAESLASDRARAQYSADALKGGTEAAAAPPPADQGVQTEDLASNTSAPEAPPPTRTASAIPPQSSAPGTLPSDTSASPPPASPTPAAAPTPAPATQVASAEVPQPAAPHYAAAPAVPAVPALTASQVSPTDAALGFRPSAAPPLDATVAQFVPASILARYRQTASIGPEPAVPSMTSGTDDSVLASNLMTPTQKTRRIRRHAVAMGGPEKMPGAVVANFDALQPTGPSAVPVSFTSGPAAVVYFPKNRTVLTQEARTQVGTAARTFMAQGGQGYVRVIGHASDDTGKVSGAQHLVQSFERSQARANAVARALIGAGVPADRVLVQTVSDPQSADGRGAEIFFQS